jgi:hypothetical protein
MFTPCHPSPQMFTELGVHFSAISEKLPYMVFQWMPNQKIWYFSAYLSDKIEKSPSPIPKMFSSRPSVTRHLNIRSKRYSKLLLIFFCSPKCPPQLTGAGSRCALSYYGKSVSRRLSISFCRYFSVARNAHLNSPAPGRPAR